MASYTEGPVPEGRAKEEISAVMFGGCGDILCDTLLDDTWIFTCTSTQKSNEYKWTQLQLPNSPTKRRSFKMSYLGIIGTKPHVMLFGGACKEGFDQTRSGISCQDTPDDGLSWIFDGSTWRRIVTDPSSAPSPRYQHSMASYSGAVVSTKNKQQSLQVVVLGGTDGLSSAMTKITNTKTYTYTPNAAGKWNVSVHTTPSARAAFAMASIPSKPGVGQRASTSGTVVLFGGQLGEQNVECNNFLSDDTWEWKNDSQWVQQKRRYNNSKEPYPWPLVRHEHTMVGMQNRMGNRFALLYGGFGGCAMSSSQQEKGHTLNDTWYVFFSDILNEVLFSFLTLFLLF